MAQIQWHWHTFTELSHATLYDILKLRQDVFILEQQCFYPDMDSQDQAALHLTGHADGKLVAYIRLLSKQKLGQPIITISRVIVASDLRGTGTGNDMMRMTLAYIDQHYPDSRVELQAQQYVRSFYEALGFVAINEPYLDDGIMHVDMRRMSD